MIIGGNRMEKYIIFEFFLCAIVIIMGVFQRNDIVSLAFYLMFIIQLLIIFQMSVNRILYNNNLFKLLLLIILLAFFNIVINSFTDSNSNFGFDYIKKYVMFISTLIFFYISLYVPVSKRIVNFIFLTWSASTVWLIISYNLWPEKCYYYRGNRSEFLTFGMQNPNKTGLFLLALFVYGVVFLFILEKKFLKIICLISLPILLFFINETQARNDLTTIVLMGGMIIYFALRGKLIISGPIRVFLVLFPLIFAILYLLFIYSDWITDTFSFMVSTGKDIDSRYSSWVGDLTYFSEHIICGAYSQISGGTGSSQCLNTHIDVLCSYGIFVFIFFIIFLNSICRKINNYTKSFKQLTALLGFFAIIFAGMGEAALVAGGTGLSVLAWGFLLLARWNPNEEFVNTSKIDKLVIFSSNMNYGGNKNA